MDPRPPAFFVGEAAALDLLNSIAAPKNIEFDWLLDGKDLLDWFVQAGLCTEAEIVHLRAKEQAEALDQSVAEIREFREHFRDFVHRSSATNQVDPADPMIGALNDLMAAGSQRLMLTKSGKLETQHNFSTPEQLLPRLAAACATLISESDFRYVRNCEGETCTLYFLDVSKNHKRRWCSMEVCGNRAKAAAHRNAKAKSKPAD